MLILGSGERGEGGGEGGTDEGATSFGDMNGMWRAVLSTRRCASSPSPSPSPQILRLPKLVYMASSPVVVSKTVDIFQLCFLLENITINS